MWVMLSGSFLSVVHKDCKPDELLVRARVKGHIEAVFPNAKVSEASHTDYRFRAVLPRSVVAQALSDQAMSLKYDNFKNTVRNNRFHDALASVWHVMARLQPTAPYTGRPQAQPRHNSLVDIY